PNEPPPRTPAPAHRPHPPRPPPPPGPPGPAPPPLPQQPLEPGLQPGQLRPGHAVGTLQVLDFREVVHGFTFLSRDVHLVPDRGPCSPSAQPTRASNPACSRY